jgi:hypothetical protein
LSQGIVHALDEQNKGVMNVPTMFNFNKIHDSVGKALRTADQASVIANSHPPY